MNQEEQQYEIEKILNHKIVKSKLYFLIKWKGYHLNESTWEPYSNFETLGDDVGFLQIQVKYYSNRNLRDWNSKNIKDSKK